jgi:hypothetical protein
VLPYLMVVEGVESGSNKIKKDSGKDIKEKS